MEMIFGGGSWKDLEDLKDTFSSQFLGQPRVRMKRLINENDYLNLR